MSSHAIVATGLSAALRIYNTQNPNRGTVTTIEPGKVGDVRLRCHRLRLAHIGHGMSSIVFDTIRRYLDAHLGYDVRHAQNFTDVDDKIINRANADGITPTSSPKRLIAEWTRGDRRASMCCRPRSTRAPPRRSRRSSR